jgi:hypothetical protein
LLSSTPYSTELTPEPRLRRAVLLAGLVASGVGVLVVVTLDVGGLWRSLAVLAWVGWSARELRVIANGYKRFGRIRIDSEGNVELLIGDVDWVAARLLSGSVVLERYAWLRIKPRHGRRYAEFIRGNSREDEMWRRLQVIWRHLGGRP